MLDVLVLLDAVGVEGLAGEVGRLGPVHHGLYLALVGLARRLLRLGSLHLLHLHFQGLLQVGHGPLGQKWEDEKTEEIYFNQNKTSVRELSSMGEPVGVMFFTISSFSFLSAGDKY